MKKLALVLSLFALHATAATIDQEDLPSGELLHEMKRSYAALGGDGVQFTAGRDFCSDVAFAADIAMTMIHQGENETRVAIRLDGLGFKDIDYGRLNQIYDNSVQNKIIIVPDDETVTNIGRVSMENVFFAGCVTERSNGSTNAEVLKVFGLGKE